MQRRVVITGLGVVAPNGIGKEGFWQACLEGRSGVRHITSFDASSLSTRIAGIVPDFDPEAFGLTGEECQALDRGTQFAVAAATLALADAKLARGWSEEEREATGVYVGAAMSSAEIGERDWIAFSRNGTETLHDVSSDSSDSNTINPARLLMSYVPSAAIAAHHRLYGPSGTIATGCSAGGDAIGQAFQTIQEGRADQMLAGGSDAGINLSGINVFSVMKALSTRNDEPERASRPYDGGRDGFVMAEGAAMLLLEEREAALARGAHIYAEIIAFATNCNAYHMTALPDDGMPLQHLLQQVMEEAGITPRHIGYINSHGSSTPSNDVAETIAYKAVFGEQAYSIPISSTKSLIGHTQGAASAIEAVATVLALEEQVLPPTINQEQPDPGCDLDYIPNVPRNAVFDIALTHSSGFGGVNSVVVLARPTWFEHRQ